MIQIQPHHLQKLERGEVITEGNYQIFKIKVLKQSLMHTLPLLILANNLLIRYQLFQKLKIKAKQTLKSHHLVLRDTRIFSNRFKDKRKITTKVINRSLRTSSITKK